MDRIEWERCIILLQHGKLELPEPEDNELSRFSAGWPPDQRRYITALERGYREQAKMLRLYRAQTCRCATLVRLMENQWSNDAALGYAAMGMQAAQIRPDQGVLALDAMMEAMERYSLDEAREVERGLREGDGLDDVAVRVLHNGGTGDGGTCAGGTCAGGTGDPSPTVTRDGEMPRVVGPSAEFVPEG